METLKILGLDDDNHSPMFRTEDHVIFNNYKELVEFLSKPHTFQVEVKMFAIVDEWSDELSEFEEEQVNHMFDFLEGISTQPEGMNFDQIFNIFWNSANRNWW